MLLTIQVYVCYIRNKYSNILALTSGITTGAMSSIVVTMPKSMVMRTCNTVVHKMCNTILVNMPTPVVAKPCSNGTNNACGASNSKIKTITVQTNRCSNILLKINITINK